jgi:lipopolysaccharide export system protein LptA
MKSAFCALLLIAMVLPASAQQSPAPAPTAPAKSEKAAKPAKQKKVANNQNSTAPGVLGSHNNNAPINVSSDNFIGDLTTKIGTYIGNVIVIQGDMRLRADRVKVNVAQGKPTRIEATGNVVVNSTSGIATGDSGIYELGPHTVTMTGRQVVLTKGKDVMRGTKLVMDMNTNLAHLYAQGMPGNRVQGLFIPPPQQNPPAAGGAKGKGKGKDKGKTAEEPAKPTRIEQTIDPNATENPAPSPPK